MELDVIYNQDCIEGMKSLPDKSIDMILCDLPYGVTRNKWDEVIPLELLWEEYKRIIKDNGAIVLHSQQPFTSKLVMSNLEMFKYSLIWSKSQVSGFLNAKRQPLREHEEICVFYKKQCVYNPQMTKGKRQKKNTGGNSSNYNNFEAKPHYSDEYYPKSILYFPLQRFKNGHPTQKPVTLEKWLIETYTNPGDIVLDNCIGSGTTAIACLETDRHYIGYELNPDYYKMAQDRILDYEFGYTE